MAPPEIVEGWLDTRHGALIRDVSVTDQELLEAMGIGGRARRAEPGVQHEHADLFYVSRDDQWLHVMDGQRLGLRSAHLRGAVHAIAQGGTESIWFLLFSSSKALEHYVSGALVRHYEEVWTQLDGLVEKIDVGEALVGETELLRRRRLPSIAELLGIAGTHSWETLRVYVLDAE